MHRLNTEIVISWVSYVKKSILLFFMMLVAHRAIASPFVDSNRFHSSELYDIVNNLQVGYYCNTGLAGPMWLLNPATCGLTRKRAFWLDGNSLETLLNYKDYFGIAQFVIDDGYVSLLLKSQLGLEPIKLLTQGNDDRLWWALAFIRAYQYNPVHTQYLEVAKAVFADIDQHYWNKTCNGGVWWDLAKTYKNAITNELFLDTAVNLYIVTHDKTYLTIAEKAANWLLSSTLINANNLVNDGLNNACKNNGEYTYTYNQGVLLDGLANLTKLTGNKTYLNMAERILAAVMNPANNLVTKNGILVGVATSPGSGTDGEAFNGIFMRHLGYFINDVSANEQKIVCNFINTNAISAASMVKWDKGGPLVPFYWYQRNDNNDIDSTTTFAAVDLFNAAKKCSILNY